MNKTETTEEADLGEAKSQTISCIKCRAAGCGELKVLVKTGWQEKTPVNGEPVYFCPICSGAVSAA